MLIFIAQLTLKTSNALYVMLHWATKTFSGHDRTDAETVVIAGDVAGLEVVVSPRLLLSSQRCSMTRKLPTGRPTPRGED